MFHDQLSLDDDLEVAAQRYAALVLQKLSSPVAGTALPNNISSPDYHTVDVNQIDLFKPRSVGAETLSLQALTQLKLDDKLRALGFNEKDLSAAIGSIVGRMLHPGSERETHRWLQQNSALDELIGHDHNTLSLDRLYQVADKLFKNKSEIEAHLAAQESELFNLQRTIILYDLTNTYFEGQALGNSKAAFGRSKEKRSDCPIVTLGLVLDGEGFPLASEIFKGNVSEAKTLETMVSRLHSRSKNKGSIVVLDAGIASQENLDWLKAQGYRYIVVSRERHKERPELSHGAVIVKDVSGDQVIAKRVVDPDTGEIRLYCHSEKREQKDLAIRTQFARRFEDKLKTLNDGLSKKGTTKKCEKIYERLGRLKEKYARVASDYDVKIETDSDKKHALKIVWARKKSGQQKDTTAGVYCLRTDVQDLTEKDLWTTYVMLTDIEACFKSLKSELGLRPIYHQKEERVSAHLFITLIAYHLVHCLRTQLKHKDIVLSWESLRSIMQSQQRISVSMPNNKAQQIHIRTTTKAEPHQQQIYKALGIEPDSLGAIKTVITG